MKTHPQSAESISFVIPARNEARTIAHVVSTCSAFIDRRGIDGEILVVSDGSSDATAHVAAKAGARVTCLPRGAGSKARAMRAGVAEAQYDVLFFLDADLLGLRVSHLEAMTQYFESGLFEMVCGTFDYGPMSSFVQRTPWSTGQRILNRSTLGDALIGVEGYAAEVAINARIGCVRGRTASLVLEGMHQRTKADKFGWRSGTYRNLVMWWRIARSSRDLGIPIREYLRYAASVEPVGGGSRRRHSSVMATLALITAALLLGSRPSPKHKS